MSDLLIVAHGSRLEASNQEVWHLAQRLQTMPAPFRNIKCAFLEVALPTIPEALIDLIEIEQAKQIVVLPYFLTAGRHVTEDIPAIINLIKNQYPDIEIVLSAYLGSDRQLSESVLNLALIAYSQLS